IEERAVDLAVAVTTICETDRGTMLDEFGCDSVLVRNGSSVADHPLRVPGADEGPDDQVDFAFAGSSYWPNVEGFGRIATPSLAFLPPGTKIHVAGSVSDQLLSSRPIAQHHSANASRMVLRGFLPVADLVDMMHRSRAVIVPVFTGEGSNLKSADALACGAPVIMTRRATHGYEDIIADDRSGVTVVGDAREFRAAMASAVASERSGPVGARRRADLGWTDRLAPLVRLVESIGRNCAPDSPGPNADVDHIE
ncbi:MAG: glycosyltransferase, partial [Ilumatobacteraceae bacterium]